MEDQRILPIRRSCLNHRRSAQTWSISFTRPMSMMPPWTHAGAGRKQRIETRARSIPKRMETVEDEITRPRAEVHRQGEGRQTSRSSCGSIDAYAHSHPPNMPQIRGVRNSQNGEHHEGRAWRARRRRRHRDEKIKDWASMNNTIVVFTPPKTGTEVLIGQTVDRRFAQERAPVLKAGLPRAAMIAGRARCRRGKVENGIHLRWTGFEPLRRGQPETLSGTEEGQDRSATRPTNVIWRLNQMGHDYRQRGSNRHEIWYFGESEWVPCASTTQVSFNRPACRMEGEKTNMTCLSDSTFAIDPFEARDGDSGTKYGAQQYFDWFKFEFCSSCCSAAGWRKLAMTARIFFVFLFPRGGGGGPRCRGRELQISRP